MKKITKLTSLFITLSTGLLSASSHFPLDFSNPDNQAQFDDNIISQKLYPVIVQTNLLDLPLSLQFSPSPLPISDSTRASLPPAFGPDFSENNHYTSSLSLLFVTTEHIGFKLLDPHGNTLYETSIAIIPEKPTPYTTSHEIRIKSEPFSYNGCSYHLELIDEEYTITSSKASPFLFNPQNFPKDYNLHFNAFSVQLLHDGCSLSTQLYHLLDNARSSFISYFNN